MRTRTLFFGPRRTRTGAGLPLLLVASLVIAAPRAASAQENQTSAPVPLARPVLETNTGANGRFDIGTLRALIQTGANVELCAILMKDAKQPVPPDFDWNKCPTQFQNEVNGGQGKVSWSSGAKPAECGTSCVGRPFMTQSTFLNRPNTIFAMLYGHLQFDVDVPGPFNRSVTYGYQVQFRCLADTAPPDSHFNVAVIFEQPVVNDPGILESIADFLALPVNLSNRITQGIRAQLTAPGSESASLARCSSIGARQAAQPSDDAVVFNIPSGTRRPPIVGGPGSEVVGRTATVHFESITRRPPTFGYTPAADPGEFEVFLNGLPVFIPQVAAADLPVAGGSVVLNLCKTIDVGGADRLQIIFANSNGGAVWSQFASGASFGADAARMVTTARTVVVAGLPGPPNPITGTSGPVKPQPIVVQEYDLSYTIDYQGATTVMERSSGAPGGAAAGATAAPRNINVRDVAINVHPRVAACRQI